MPRKKHELNQELLEDCFRDDDQVSTEELRKRYLEESGRESLAHKVVKRNLEKLEAFEQVETPDGVKLILWRKVN